MGLEITYNNFEISLVVFMQNITTNHAITYTNIHRSLVFTWVWFSDVVLMNQTVDCWVWACIAYVPGKFVFVVVL